MHIMLNKNPQVVQLRNKSSQRQRNLQQRSNHLYQKDNLDIIHKIKDLKKERDLRMDQSRHYQVLEEGVKIVPLDYCLQKLQQKEVIQVQFQTRRKVMDKFPNIFKR